MCCFVISKLDFEEEQNSVVMIEQEDNTSSSDQDSNGNCAVPVLYNSFYTSDSCVL